jgi:hypothetical protein
MLGPLISIPLIGLAVRLCWKVVALFRRGSAGTYWWIAFLFIVAAGASGGYRLARVDLRVSPTFRWVGLPMPIGFFQLEEGRWTDFIPPLPIQLLNLLADVVVPITVLLPCLLLTWRLVRSNPRSTARANPGLHWTAR